MMIFLFAQLALSASQLSILGVTGDPPQYGKLTDALGDGKGYTTGYCYGRGDVLHGDWAGRGDLNYLLYACDHGLCSSSNPDFNISPRNFSVASDANIYNGMSVTSNSLTLDCWFEVRLPKPRYMSVFFARLLHKKPLTFTFMDKDRNVLKEFTREQDETYFGVEQQVEVDNVAYVRLSTEVDPGKRGYCYAGTGDCPAFTIITFGARDRKCDHWISVELEKFSTVESLTFQYTKDASGYNILTSLDGVTYTEQYHLEKVWQWNDVENVTFDKEIRAKFVKIQLIVKDEPFIKSDVKKIKVYGKELNDCNGCSGHGKCVNNKCVCNSGYYNSDCSSNVLECPPGYEGVDCKTPICSYNCWGRGKCVSPGKCQCNSPHTGYDCRIDLIQDTLSSDLDVVKTITPDPGVIDSGCSSDKPRKCRNGKCAKSYGECHEQTDAITADGIAPNPYPVVITTSSEKSEEKVSKIIDGDFSSFWQSGACYNYGFVDREDTNLLLNVCKESPDSCSGTIKDGNWEYLTDNNSSTSSSFSATDNGKSWWKIAFQEEMDDFHLFRTRFRAVDEKPLSLVGYLKDGTSKVLGTTTGKNYDTWIQPISDKQTKFVAIGLNGTGQFSHQYIGLLRGYCNEWAQLDLGEAKQIGLIRGKHGNSNDHINSVQYQTSVDGATWTTHDYFNYNNYYTIDIPFNVPITARYVRVILFTDDFDNVKTMIWELQAFPPSGYSAPYPSAHPNQKTMREITGTNAIWGFPERRFTDLVSHARNYHNLNWDLGKYLNLPPIYSNMSGKMGTRGQWWLNWDQTYGGWREIGKYDTHVSIQFHDYTYDLKDWNKDNTYWFGYFFARHFGALHGTGDVKVVEIGNEPWGFTNEMYKMIMENMARGMKDADPTLKVVPAAMNGLDRYVQIIDRENLKYLDGFNIHSYSFKGGNKTKEGTNPENVGSTFRELNNIVKFRDINFPELPLYLSEFGWDAKGENNLCKMSTCVSSEEQAIYLVRGLAIVARLGFEKASIFDFQDSSSYSSVIYSRSGLLEGKNDGNIRKLSWYTIRNFVRVFGDAKFQSVIREDAEAYIYKFDINGKVAVMAWRPISGNEEDTIEIEFDSPVPDATSFHTVKFGYKSTMAGPTVKHENGRDTIGISRYPIVIVYDPVQCDGCKGICFNGKCGCNENSWGEKCENVECENMCWDQGVCQANGRCKCDSEDLDEEQSCRYAKCHANCTKNGGKCVKGKCVCPTGYTGDDCLTIRCPFDCRKRGKCVDGKCICDNNLTMMQPSCEWINEKLNRPLDIDLNRCKSDKPFRCPDGSCRKSRGECIKTSAKSFDFQSFKNRPLEVTNVYVSSNPDGANAISNGNTENAWAPTNPVRQNYNNRPDINKLFNLCSQEGACQHTSISNQYGIELVTEPTNNKAVDLTVENGISYVIFNKEISDLYEANIRGYLPKGTPDSVVNIEGEKGGKWVKLGSVTFKTTNTLYRFDINDKSTFSKIRVSSSSPFCLITFAVQSGPLTEWGVIDFGQAKKVGSVRIRVWTKEDKITTYFEYSNDNLTWTKFYQVDPKLLYVHEIATSFSARYVRVIHYLPQDKSVKPSIWLIEAYGEHGVNGPDPSPVANKRTIHQILGINGIWQWGTNGDEYEEGSDSTASVFSAFSSHGRNYHNLNWDTPSPYNVPDYDEMPGSLSQNWLDWDKEYEIWNNYSLEVQVSYQFLPNTVPFTDFGDTYEEVVNNTKNLGKAFAKHFGPTSGTGNVFTFEIGNEPWEYDAKTQFKPIFEGFSQGLKEGDPRIIVLPPAYDSLSNLEIYLTPESIKNIDGLNVHSYSMRWNGEYRDGAPPEDRASSFSKVKEICRWRDANAPNLDVYLSEWGWSALDHQCKGTYCVSELQQSIYTLRGLFLTSRWNLFRSSLFFYADDEGCGTNNENLFSCSGILGKKASTYYRKVLYDSLVDLVRIIGDYKFDKVIKEDDEAYIYQYAKDNNKIYIGWLPSDKINISKECTFSVDFKPKAIITLGKRVASIDYDWKYNKGQLTVNLTSFPKVIRREEYEEQLGDHSSYCICNENCEENCAGLKEDGQVISFTQASDTLRKNTKEALDIIIGGSNKDRLLSLKEGDLGAKTIHFHANTKQLIEIDFSWQIENKKYTYENIDLMIKRTGDKTKEDIVIDFTKLSLSDSVITTAQKISLNVINFKTDINSIQNQFFSSITAKNCEITDSSLSKIDISSSSSASFTSSSGTTTPVIVTSSSFKVKSDTSSHIEISANNDVTSIPPVDIILTNPNSAKLVFDEKVSNLVENKVYVEVEKNVNLEINYPEGANAPVISVEDGANVQYKKYSLETTKKSLSSGSVAGIVIGSIVVVAVLLAVIIFVVRTRTSLAESSSEQMNV